ncbi:amino acid adenylation domain-containing protein/non-ribosomal peptide synthase protein (TIGR01720 family) [Paenibacillus shirakamiensis]|uniref:Amino acid adenylation domain-containing protein/non-ribosomal peptide synthase protein (TIGR01720 family) n=1 Tax=Paenibacillus shirakamiensis TaxID=1265935 RepID=A0ABS4JFY5_9BACL|nr:non-ribosomal peptide synthetase [Paenibacillus shirakamiensis]MBP2000612.1 amino acid adenylation domain-containing protein/non-ribosomal peptide synthase protein (TIGR01720 family) [Paenibacillus shirakamiensis]
MSRIPLTHPQKRIWYIENIFPDTSMYNIGGPIRIHGPIDFSILEQAILSFIEHHDGVRLQLREEHGEVFQEVVHLGRTPLDFMDFSPYEKPEEEFQRWIEEESARPFHLTEGPLYYFALFTCSDQENGYYVKLHHMIADGWSNQIITEYVTNYYTAHFAQQSNGEFEHQFNKPPSYVDYALQEPIYLDSKRYQKNRKFWLNQYETLPEMLRADRSSTDTKGNRISYSIDPHLSSTLKTYTQKHGISLNTFFIFLYFLYMNKTTHQHDLVIGTPVLNRSGIKEKSTFGMFTSTMPFRFRLNDEQSVLDTLTRIQKELMTCYIHQKYPYEQLIQELELKKKGYDQLFHTCVNYYNTKLATNFNGMPVTNTEFYNGNQLYAMQWVIKDWSETDGLVLDIDYKCSEYTAEQVDEMLRCIRNLIRHILADPEQMLSNISLLSSEEWNQAVYDFNKTTTAYPRQYTVSQLFEEQVNHSYNQVAVRYGEEQLTYGELNSKANQLARELRLRGVGYGHWVGICIEHSLETVVAIFAVLKAGAAYLPIDPAYPSDRIQYMVEDSGTKLILTHVGGRLEIGISERLSSLEWLDVNDPKWYTGDTSNLMLDIQPDHLAYVIYTSGSTGRPKGTLIEHQGLTNYIWWATLMYVSKEREVFPLYSSLAFDLTVTSIFTPLISGGMILVYRDTGDEFILHRIMKENEATVVKLTPAHLSLLKDQSYPSSSVKRFIVGGEELKVNLAEMIEHIFSGDIEIYNEYGPTETVVGCMIHKFNRLADRKASVPIGVPAHNVMIYVLDPHCNPVPEGVIGELYISGDGVARGYLNQKELSATRFLDNPFVPGYRMYRTGDLALRLKNGIIEYCGRSDHQVKIRGHRIELTEIEKQLLEHTAVVDAVVIDLEDSSSAKYLSAYILVDGLVSNDELREWLNATLPDYMVPTFYTRLSEIPINVSGKVDRTRLPEPDRSALVAEYVPSRNEKEHLLVHVLREILQVEQIGMQDHFYHMGGDSIKAIQLASRLNNAGYTLKVSHILAHPRIGEMAQYIELETMSMVNQEPCTGVIPRLPIQQWFWTQQFAHPEHYHQSVLLKLKQTVQPIIIHRIIDQLIDHHDVLRANVATDGQTLFYNSKDMRGTLASTLLIFDLRDLSDEQRHIQMAEIAEKLKASLDLQSGYLFQACLFDLGVQGQRLLLTAHHLVIDGVSWRILLEDMVQLLEHNQAGNSDQLPNKTDSIQSWATWIQEEKGHVRKERMYWQSIVDKMQPVPVDQMLGEDTWARARILTHEFDVEITQQWLNESHKGYGTEPLDLLLVTLGLTLKEYFKMELPIVELEGHGREELHSNLNLTRSVGWFTSLYPMQLEVSEDLATTIKSIKEELRCIPNHGIGFGILHYISHEIAGYAKFKPIRFNYLGDFGSTFTNAWFTHLSQESKGSDVSKENHLTAALEVNMMLIDQRLHLAVTYSENHFYPETMEGWIRMYSNTFQGIVNHCCLKGDTDYTPSDFETAALSQSELDSLLF